jgi:hypothetical protein
MPYSTNASRPDAPSTERSNPAAETKRPAADSSTARSIINSL